MTNFVREENAAVESSGRPDKQARYQNNSKTATLRAELGEESCCGTCFGGSHSPILAAVDASRIVFSEAWSALALSSIHRIAHRLQASHSMRFAGTFLPF